MDANFNVKIVLDILMYEPSSADDDNETSSIRESPLSLPQDPRLRSAEKKYDFASDVWGFGVTALSLDLGCLPIDYCNCLRILMKNFQTERTKESHRNVFSSSMSVHRKMSCFATTEHASEHDKEFKAFVHMVKWCLKPRGLKRPTVEQLMQHNFFKEVGVDVMGTTSKKIMMEQLGDLKKD